MKCQWVNKKGGPCPWKALADDRMYCKRHSVYEGVFTPADIPQLTQCGGCRNLFRAEEGSGRMCEKCAQRGALNRIRAREQRTTKPKCVAITHAGTRCRKNAVPNAKYCGEHRDTWDKQDDLVAGGNRVCGNWNTRGCLGVVTNSRWSLCDTCRERGRLDDSARRGKTREIVAGNLSRIGGGENLPETLTCRVCQNEQRGELFYSGENITHECVYCREKSFMIQLERNAKSRLGQSFQEYIKKCHNKGIPFELNREEFQGVLEQPCTYCGDTLSISTIDRVDNSGGQTPDNCVPACLKCNMMRGTASCEDFVARCVHIAKQRRKLRRGGEQRPDLFRNCLSDQTKKKQWAGKRGISWALSIEVHDALTRGGCAQCGLEPTLGIDRVNNYQGYFDDNCVGCCFTCNSMKRDYMVEDFVNRCASVAQKKILNKPFNPRNLSIREQIIRASERSLNRVIDGFGEFRKQREPAVQQERLLFQPRTWADVERCEPELIHIGSGDIACLDIWEWVRHNISSFRVPEGGKNHGRRWKILVRDRVTRAVLGVASLGSDMLAQKGRDAMIGWGAEFRMGRAEQNRLKQLMNIDTCVPVQPFGERCNGGKLIASLMFTQGVYDTFMEKQGEPLLGLTTTSLQGRSVMQERLPFLRQCGLTQGNSVWKMNGEVMRLCKEHQATLTGCERVDTRQKFFILRKVFTDLKIPKNQFLRANPKGVYFGFMGVAGRRVKENGVEQWRVATAKERRVAEAPIREFLCGSTDVPPNVGSGLPTADEVYTWWRERWGRRRFERELNSG